MIGRVCPWRYTAPEGPTNAIQYEDVYLANDENNLYIRFTLYSPRANAFANSHDNLFFDADNNSATGFPTGGIGSEMLIQWGGGYQEKNGGFNEGAVNNLGWGLRRLRGQPWNSSWPFRAAPLMPRTAAWYSPTTPLQSVLEGDSTCGSVELCRLPGGLAYTF